MGIFYVPLLILICIQGWVGATVLEDLMGESAGCVVRPGFKSWLLAFASCVTLSKLLNLSELQFLHLKNGLISTWLERS